MRLLVCGDRHWTDSAKLFAELNRLHQISPISCIIEGEAKGADLLGRAWAEANTIPVEPYPADWKTYGKAAGPIRNKQMLTQGKPDLVLAFHSHIASSKGTKNMLAIASQANVPVELVV